MVIHVKDVNDNPPVFERPTYRTQITEEDDRNLPKSVLRASVSHALSLSTTIVTPSTSCMPEGVGASKEPPNGPQLKLTSFERAGATFVKANECACRNAKLCPDENVVWRDAEKGTTESRNVTVPFGGDFSR